MIDEKGVNYKISYITKEKEIIDKEKLGYIIAKKILRIILNSENISSVAFKNS
jgi:hypothetical protein